jgi:NAD(P)H-flavin reductase
MNAVAAAAPMVPRPAKIRRVVRETAETFTLELPADGATPFLPGQFNMLYVFGVGEVAISISGDPARRDRVVHTTRAVGTVTRAMQRLRRGAALGVRGPFGVGWPVGEARGKDVVLVAGGIGLAPLRPVVYAILTQRPEFGRVALLYGARGPEDILYGAEIERWRARGIAVEVTVDHATHGWAGDVGVVTSLVPRVTFDPTNTIAMVCGPEIMMRFAAQALAARGVPEAQISVSLERNMKCALGWCGHCQLGPAFVCKDGPVFPYPRVRNALTVREL